MYLKEILCITLPYLCDVCKFFFCYGFRRYDFSWLSIVRQNKRDKEIVEVPWCGTLWQSFNWKTCCHLMYTCIVYVCKLCLKNHWVTLHPWVCHLKCSLCLLALPKESLGYTAPMGVPPKVQPTLTLLALPKESLAYTVLTDVCLALSSKTKKL